MACHTDDSRRTFLVRKQSVILLHLDILRQKYLIQLFLFLPCRRNHFVTNTEQSAQSSPREREPNEANIRALVEAFYGRVDDDALLGPIFAHELTGRWDEHLAKMMTFWSSLVLGSKQYRGNVQEAHRPLADIEPRHFARSSSVNRRISAVQRVSAASSDSRASTQRSPASVFSFFQNGACVLR